MVDWSASATPKMGKDSIWLCIGNHLGPSVPENLSTRDQAVERIVEITLECVESSRRVLIGFDFAFGYPIGFGTRAWPEIQGEPWVKVWKGLLGEVKGDTQAKGNGFDRFAFAQKLNERVAGGGGKAGPFWGCPVKSNWIGPKKPIPFPLNLGRLRVTERQISGVQETWKLYAPGSVGSQTLLGIPRVADLRFNHFKDISEVWPFESGFSTGSKQVVFAEIWPGIVNGAVTQKERNRQEVRDALQVESMVEWCIRQDDLGRLGGWLSPEVGDPDKVVSEEGWILGVGEQVDVADLFAYAFATARESGMSEEEISQLVERFKDLKTHPN